MTDAFVEYLKAKSAPASSLELAQQVLKIIIQDEHIADKIILPLLQNNPQIKLNSDHLWMLEHIDPPAMAKKDMVLCKLMPVKAYSIYQWREAACVVISNGQAASKKFFTLYGNEIENGFRDMLRFIGNTPVMFDGFGNQISLFHKAAYALNGMEMEQPVLSLKRLLKQTCPQKIIREPAQAAQVLGLAFYESDDIRIQLQLFVEEFLILLQMLQSKNIYTWSDFIQFYEGDKADVDYTSYAFDRSFVEKLPSTPGVYIMRDRDDQVIYVGKAKNLASRLRSYFKNSDDADEKINLVRDRLYQIEINHTGSEMEALLLEQKYIGQFHPPINKQIKIYQRAHKKKSRYQRIVLLPSEVTDHLKVYVLSSEWGVQSIDLAADFSNFSQLKSMVRKAFFSKIKPASAAVDENLEIVTSWLSLHEDEIHSIDMRKIATLKEAERILVDHVKSFFKHTEKVIHY